MTFRSSNACLRATAVAAVIVAGHVSPVLAQDEEKMALGKKVFTEIAEPQCAVCHTLADAGATGTLGINLDTIELSEERVRLAVEQGVGVMPPFADKLDEDEIAAVAHYVANASGGT